MISQIKFKKIFDEKIIYDCPGARGDSGPGDPEVIFIKIYSY